MSWALRLLAGILLACHVGAAFGVVVVRFPRPEFEGDHRYDYAMQLLQLALSKIDRGYRIETADVVMNQERQVIELEAHRTIDVAPIPSSADREARLLPVRIPINKGVLGWRLGLIRKGDAARFAKVDTLSQLKDIRLAQGQEWPDTLILQANGIPVITAPRYDGLFKMLESKRFDYFPRSVAEIWDEQERYSGTLEIEPHIALHYRYDAYFMVNRNDTALARDIGVGLEKALADGSLDKLFLQYFGERLRKAGLEKRTVIELTNPLLAPGAAEQPDLWYDWRRPAPATK
jgi:hypothetical protein